MAKMLHKLVIFPLMVLSVIILYGCQINSQPRMRVSDYFGSPTEMRFPDPKNLGTHSLNNPSKEKLGIVYTCKAGFIDLGHLREAADRTRYAARTLYPVLLNKQKYCTLKIIEPSRYHLTIRYPNEWDILSPKRERAIAREVAIAYGQYLAHTSLIWHEIITWYGFASSGIFSENISAFSCEDPYSDVLGTHLAVKALRDTSKPYEQAMTDLIYETLEQLEVQPAAVAKRAAKSVHDKWYEGGYYLFVKMKKRNFDVGLDDGMLTPWILSDVCPGITGQDYPAASPGAVLEQYGFDMRLEIEPVEFEKEKIYKANHLKDRETIRPAFHFSQIIENIRKEAKKLEGTEVDLRSGSQTTQKQ